MTIKIGKFRITLFKFEKLETPILSVNSEAKAADVLAITSTPEFAKLRKQAQEARGKRQLIVQ